MYCAPVFVYLVSFALKLESPSALKWTAMAVVMLGVAFLTRIYGIDAIVVTALGVAAELLSGLSYAIFIFDFKYAAPLCRLAEEQILHLFAGHRHAQRAQFMHNADCVTVLLEHVG